LVQRDNGFDFAAMWKEWKESIMVVSNYDAQSSELSIAKEAQQNKVKR
jgi:hypothetical protein